MRRSYRSLYIQPSSPLRTPSLQSLDPVRKTSVPLLTLSLTSFPQVRKPSMPLRASSLQSAFSPQSSLDSISVAERARFFAKTPSVHPVLALRYKWRTACARALQTDKPNENLLAAMQHRGVALPAPVKIDFVRTVSSAALLSTARRGSAAHLLAERAPRFARAASLIDASASDFIPSAAAIKRRSSDCDLRLCTAWRTELNTLMRPPCTTSTTEQDAAQPRLPGASTWRTELNSRMRLPPPNKTEETSRLPGALRCAKAHAPRVRGRCAELKASREGSK